MGSCCCKNTDNGSYGSVFNEYKYSSGMNQWTQSNSRGRSRERGPLLKSTKSSTYKWN